METLRESSARGPASFTLLVPAAWEVGDPHGGRETALRRLKGALRRLRDAGLQVEGVLGDPDPALAVEQVWDPERFDEIIISTLPARISNWLKLDLPRRVERFTARSVQHVVASEIGEREITTTPTDPQRPADLAKESTLTRPHPPWLAAGVDDLEGDVCLTADAALVLLHDPYLPLGTDLEGLARAHRP